MGSVSRGDVQFSRQKRPEGRDGDPAAAEARPGPALSQAVARRASRPTGIGEDLSAGDPGAQTPGRQPAQPLSTAVLSRDRTVLGVDARRVVCGLPLTVPHAPAIQALSRLEFIEAAWPLIGPKVNKRAKLQELYELAQSSIALPVPVDSPAIDTFRLQLAHFARLAELRRELEAQAHRLLKDRRDYQCLCSCPVLPRSWPW